jgi:hypothetical protein
MQADPERVSADIQTRGCNKPALVGRVRNSLRALELLRENLDAA